MQLRTKNNIKSPVDVEYVFYHQRLISQNHSSFLFLLNFTLVHENLLRYRESQKRSQSLTACIFLALHQMPLKCLSFVQIICQLGYNNALDQHWLHRSQITSHLPNASTQTTQYLSNRPKPIHKICKTLALCSYMVHTSEVNKKRTRLSFDIMGQDFL